MIVDASSDQLCIGKAVETAKNVFEMLAIATGGAWAYFNYFRGRTYRPRLELAISASVERCAGRSFLKAMVTVKNVGLSKIPIEQKGSGLLVYTGILPNPGPAFPSQVRWSKDPYAFDVFTDHKWIEPNETVGQPFMISLPHNNVPAYRRLR